ncbi:MAG: signal peptidase II [Lachnospiraceae bacterium]|nr:signal peptidase II [Lachnospiraceae bacterium]
MKKYIMIIIDIVLAILLVLFDQFTKYLAIANLKQKAAYTVIDKVFELQYLENRGSAFGILQNQKMFILFVGVVFMAVICYFMIRLPMKNKFIILHVLLSFIFAGGVGNMIDRIRYDYVVDFFSFILINFPVFNVADCYIVVATIVLFFLFVFYYSEADLDFLKLKASKTREIK